MSIEIHPIDLATIAEATRTKGYMFIPERALTDFDPAFVEYDKRLCDSEGRIAVRVNSSGFKFLAMGDPRPFPASDVIHVARDAAGFKFLDQIENTTSSNEVQISNIVASVPIPDLAKRAGRTPKPDPYQFDKLEVGASVFVSGGDVKKLSSTVSNANKKYAPKRFVIRAVANGGPWGFLSTGVGIWRVEDAQ